jgi:RNA polymerase subunit RPABC4/transcription elongation factor Spt4
MATSENTATRRCPNCDQEIDAESESCPACGTMFIEAFCDDHPERRAAGACIVCGRRVCDDCGIDERGYCVCSEHADIPIFEGWAQLYTTPEEVEAQLIRDNLHAEGIDAEILSQKDRTLTFDLGDFAHIRVLVPAFSWIDARKVLHRHMDPEGEVAFACPSCGATYEPGDMICRSCGAELPRAMA